ncbi:hypothetical protein GCM10029992_65850 [Glycomyces albus]
MAAGLTALVVAGGVGAALTLHDNYGQGDYSTNLLAYDDSVQGHVEITFEVYKPAGEGAVCRVRSRDLAGAEVGAAEVVIAPGEATRVVTSYTLAVTGNPIAAKSSGAGRRIDLIDSGPPHRNHGRRVFRYSEEVARLAPQRTNRNIRRMLNL